MNIDSIENGIVLDHINAKKSFEIYEILKLGELDCSVAIITNAKSKKMGKKDIIKIAKNIDIDFGMLGYIDSNITVNKIENGERVKKYKVGIPEKVVNMVKCKNPRCITSEEQEIDHIFILTDKEKKLYRCKYCETLSQE